MDSRPRALAVLLLVAAAAPFAAAAASDPCPGFEFVPDVGPACRGADGLLHLVAEDGTFRGSTHGPDPRASPAASGPIVVAAARAPPCASDPATQYHARVIYARATDDANNYASTIATIRAQVDEMNGLVYDTAAGLGRAAEFRVHCTGSVVTVDEAVLPTAKAAATFTTITNDLAALGYNNARIKYWVWYDDPGACTCGGQGSLYSDDSLAAGNLNNGAGTAMYAVTYASSDFRTWLHEVSHTMGAVQDSAPHATRAGHCNDGLDVMCYNDGGSAAVYNPGVCTGGQKYDCGNDDYFHPDPAAGSYLATKWNLGSSLNRFLVHGSRQNPPSAAFRFAPASPTTQDAVQFTDESTDSDGTVRAWTWNFGDGSSSNDRNPSRSYRKAGVYVVTLTATDDRDAISVTTRTISVANALPTANFATSPAAPTTADTVTFTDTSTDADGTLVRWLWDFGDGSTSSLRSPTHKFADDGTYEVFLQATDDDGGISTRTRSVTVLNRLPVAAIIVPSPSPRTLENATLLSDASDPDGTIVSRFWTFGDGYWSTAKDPAHRWAKAGLYNVTLRVRDDDGGEAVGSATVRVLNRPPEVNLSYFPESPTSHDVVRLADTSTDEDGFIANATWTTEDETSSGPEFERSFPSGEHVVRLEVEDDDGATGRATLTLRVANAPPRADLAASSVSVFTGEPVSFEDRSTDLNGRIVARSWAFGDGNTATGATTTHTFAVPCRCVVTLAVTDDDGGTSRARATVEAKNRPPVAAFGDLAAAVAGDPATFTGTATDPEGAALSHTWDFGDGSTATGSSVTHTYASDGYYNLKLTVTDEHGGESVVERTVAVQAAPSLPAPAPALVAAGVACLAAALVARRR